jgi:hypothetical protein
MVVSAMDDRSHRPDRGGGQLADAPPPLGHRFYRDCCGVLVGPVSRDRTSGLPQSVTLSRSKALFLLQKFGF